MRPTNILILITSFAITFGADWTDTTWEENPFMVHLLIETPDGSSACGGSITYKGDDNNNAVILTAAHCVADASNVYVQVGCTKTDCSDDGVLTYSSNNYVVHPQYNSTTPGTNIYYADNDIALVYLANAISNPGASQVTLHSNIDILQNDAEITIFGYWGTCEHLGDKCVGGSDTDTLEYAVTNYMIMLECIHHYYSYVIGPHDFCVKDDNSENGLQSICNGDSGSPAFYKGSQIGINSFVLVGCDASKPAVLTSIPYYYDWIKSECPQCANTKVPTKQPTKVPTKRPTAPTTAHPTREPYCISIWTFCGNGCARGETKIGTRTCWTFLGRTVKKHLCKKCYAMGSAPGNNLLDIDNDDNDNDNDVVDHIQILLNVLIVLLVITITLLVCNFISKMVICCNKSIFKKSPNYKIVKNYEMDDMQDINVE